MPILSPQFVYLVEKSSSAPVTIQFYDVTAGGTGSYTWAWDFGDGDTSTSQSPSHAYATTGTYTVSLTVTDSVPTTTSYTIPVYVFVRPNVSPLGLLSQTIESGTSCEITGISAPASSYLGGATILFFILVPGGADIGARENSSFNYGSISASDDTTPGRYGDQIWSDGGNQYYLTGGLQERLFLNDSDSVPYEGAWGVGLVMNEITTGDTITIEFGDTYSTMTVIVLGYTGVQFDNRAMWPGVGAPIADEPLDYADEFLWTAAQMLPATSSSRPNAPPDPILIAGGWQTDFGATTFTGGVWWPNMDYLHADYPTSDSVGTTFNFGDELANPGHPIGDPGRPIMVYGHYLVAMMLAFSGYNIVCFDGGFVYASIEDGSLTSDQAVTGRVVQDDLNADAGGGSGESIILGDTPIGSQDLVYPAGYHLTDNAISGRNAEGTVINAVDLPGGQLGFNVEYFGLGLVAGFGPWIGGGLHIWQRI